MIIAFQSLFSISVGTCLVTLLSTSVKSYAGNQYFIAPIYNGTLMTDRNKETSRSICALEDIWEELQPGIITVHDQLAFSIFIVLCLDLREPCVLCCESRCSVRFGKVQDYIDERGYRARGNSFDARHGNCRRCSVRGERKCGAISYKTS